MPLSEAFIQRTVTVGTSSTVLLAASPRRSGLLISAPTTNRFTLSLETTAVLDEGLDVHPGMPPLVLTAAEHGDIVRQPWSAVSATASQSVTVVELFA